MKLEAENTAAASHLAEAERAIATERLELQAELKKWKTEVVEEKKEKEQLLKDMRVRVDDAKGGHQALKNRAIATEASKTGLQAEIRNIGEDVVKMDKKATQLLREKHEMWQCISELQNLSHVVGKYELEMMEMDGGAAAALERLYHQRRHELSSCRHIHKTLSPAWGQL